jgi:glycosyltransferase involved in cell wall biosynthesis
VKVPKLLIVVGILRRGGTERQMVELVRSAHPEHARCTVVCLVPGGELVGEMRALGVRVEELDFRFPNYHRAIAKLVRVLRHERPDAIYTLLYHSSVYTLPIARLVHPRAARVAGRRCMPALDTAGVPGARWFRRLSDRLTDAVIANSPSVRDAWVEENRRLAGRITVVPNGIRTPSLPPAPAPPGGRLRIVCVATLAPLKGHAVLVEALAAIAARDDWTLDVVGEGDERANIEALLRRHDLTGRVTMHGALPSEDVHALLESADVAVLPSLSEGLPNSVMEAMGHGVPVVASDVGSVRELLASGGGIVVPPGEPEPLAAALTELLDDPARRSEAGAAGRREIAQNYSVDAMRDATLHVVGEALRR